MEEEIFLSWNDTRKDSCGVGVPCSQEKVGGLEEALGMVVREFEEEKRLTENTHTQEIQAAR